VIEKICEELHKLFDKPTIPEDVSTSIISEKGPRKEFENAATANVYLVAGFSLTTSFCSSATLSPIGFKSAICLVEPSRENTW
jgi:hypothetical protein